MRPRLLKESGYKPIKNISKIIINNIKIFYVILNKK